MSQRIDLTTRKNRKRKGQGLTEFALVMPILLLLLFGVIDFGWMVFNYAQLYNSLREGLRWGTVPGPDSTLLQYKNCAGIKSRITELAGSSGIQASNITITYDSGDPNTAVGTCDTTFTPAVGVTDVQSGDRVIVNISVDVPFLTPFLRALFPSGLNISLKAGRTLYPD